jgi:hypothetical protein
MNHIDAAILDLTEWFCRRFQVLTGRTNVWLAVQLTNLSIIVYFVWAGVYFWRSDVGTRIALGVFWSGVLYALTQTIFKEPIEAYENNAYRRVAKGFRNPRRIRDAPLRISFLTLSLALLYPIALAYIHLRVRIALLSYSLIVLTTVVLYVLACDPLPPCPGKVRAWLRRLVLSRVAATESSSGLDSVHLDVRPIGRHRSGAPLPRCESERTDFRDGFTSAVSARFGVRVVSSSRCDRS